MLKFLSLIVSKIFKVSFILNLTTHGKPLLFIFINKKEQVVYSTCSSAYVPLYSILSKTFEFGILYNSSM